MNTITSTELKARLNGPEPVQLLMALDRNSFERQHIPGSMHFDCLQDATACLSLDRAVVVYDTNPACPASYRSYYQLIHLGFKNVYRFAGGLEEWTAAGYPVEGKDW